MAPSWQDLILKQLGRAAQDVVREVSRQASAAARKAAGATRPPSTDRGAPKLSRRYPGDYRGRPSIAYDPHTGSLPDPGEVVWAWVPYEDDHQQGKDRPVLLIGRDGDWFLGVYLSSTDHEADADQEAAAGRHWTEVGTGAWDAKRRESYARVDRIVRVHPDDVRGRAEKLDKVRFDRIAAAIRRHT
jgi:hypothetical protein